MNFRKIDPDTAEDKLGRTVETTALTTTPVDSTLEQRTYDFEAKLHFVDSVEEDEEDEDEDRIPISKLESTMIIEADVNRTPDEKDST